MSRPRTACIALLPLLAAGTAAAMVEYRQMATDAARDGGCEVASLEQRGQENGVLIYDVRCEDSAIAEVRCDPNGCVLARPDPGEEPAD